MLWMNPLSCFQNFAALEKNKSLCLKFFVGHIVMGIMARISLYINYFFCLGAFVILSRCNRKKNTFLFFMFHYHTHMECINHLVVMECHWCGFYRRYCCQQFDYDIAMVGLPCMQKKIRHTGRLCIIGCVFNVLWIYSFKLAIKLALAYIG